MSSNIRSQLLAELEKHRNALIVSVMYSRYAEMSTDDASIVYEVLKQTLSKRNMTKTDRIEILLDSLGGEAQAAYRIISVARMFAEKALNVIVAEKAKSAATLLALGSDKIYMTRWAELGPIDPIVSHPLMTNVMIPARAVQIFIDLILPMLLSKYGPAVSEYFLKIDYSHVGFCRASIEVAREYAKRLLSSYHMKGKHDEEIEDLVAKLLSYPSHDFVIDFEEAKSIGLNVEILPPEDEDIVWKLQREYRRVLDDVVLIVESKDYSREEKRPKVTLW